MVYHKVACVGKDAPPDAIAVTQFVHTVGRGVSNTRSLESDCRRLQSCFYGGFSFRSRFVSSLCCAAAEVIPLRPCTETVSETMLTHCTTELSVIPVPGILLG